MLKSAVYAAQKKIAGRVSVSDDQIRELLDALLHAPGRRLAPALAATALAVSPVMLRGAVLHAQAAAERGGLSRAPGGRRRRDGHPGRGAAAGAVRDPAVTDHVSARRRREVIDALRRGTVPANGLDLLAVGLERFTPALDADLDAAAGGGSAFKAVRGEYGAGKTFVSRYLAERALRRGFAAAEVQISETETPLHKLETVYRRIGEALRTAAFPPSALRPVLDSWLFTLESDVTAADPGLAEQGRPRWTRPCNGSWSSGWPRSPRAPPRSPRRCGPTARR